MSGRSKYNYRINYDRAIGRYAESDPLGLRAGINTYAYVDGEPVSLVDPLRVPIMKIEFVGAVGLGALWVLSASGCSARDMRVGTYRCSQLTEYFYGDPLEARVSRFSEAPLDKQYAVYICGNQYLEPPATYLARPLAREGSKAVVLLKEKLSRANDDGTIRDLILVFAEMSRQKTYAVSTDQELMKLITDSVSRMKDGGWRRIAEGMLGEIKSGTSSESPDGRLNTGEK